jgi:hypothetical protein
VIHWQKQGAAWVGTLKLGDGNAANIVLLGGRDNPKGAVLVTAARGGSPEKRVLGGVLELLSPRQAIEILCMQQRAFGSCTHLPPPDA